MNHRRLFSSAALALLVVCGLQHAVRAQSPTPGEIPVDSWPRTVNEGSDKLTIYEPQIESWQGNTLRARAAIGVETPALPKPTYGVVYYTARAEVDKAAGMVTLNDFRVTSASFPVEPGRKQTYMATLNQAASNKQPMTIALERLEANLSITQATSATRSVPVNNAPPRIIVSYTPALLVLVDGEPALRAFPETSFMRVINTRALILLDKPSGTYYLFAANYWYEASDIQGPWRHKLIVGYELNQAKDVAEKSGQVTLMANDAVKKAYGDSTPTIYVSLKPAELVHLNGQPQSHRSRARSCSRSATRPTMCSSTPETRITTCASLGAGSNRRASTGPGRSSRRTHFRRISRRSPNSIRKRMCSRRLRAPSRRKKR